MTVHSAKLLTNEEWGSLIEVAVSVPDHSAKLVSLVHVAMIESDPRVTGDGLTRITEIE
jgi:hypothetical protein